MFRRFVAFSLVEFGRFVESSRVGWSAAAQSSAVS